MGQFFYGDNLDVLRGRDIKDESVDLVYLDPPFNSERDYNMPLTEEDGSISQAQRRAFEDSWTMDRSAREALSFLTLPGKDRWKVPAKLSETFEMLHRILGDDSSMLAYLAMMGVRLVELRRVLKAKGAIYLHCDQTASHYLKLVLDVLFGGASFRGQVIWRRSRAHNDRTLRHFGSVHDTLLFYSRGDEWTFNVQFSKRDPNAPKTHDLYRHTDGLIYRKDNCRAPGNRGPKYTWNGHTQHWRYSLEERDRLIAAGRIVYSKTGMPRVLRPVDPERGSPLQDIWTDIDPPNPGSAESLGYPTQKPVALLERILLASSNEGDVVLDPFAGCGTTIEAAEKLGRQWIGIDITHLAVSVLRRRMEKKFPSLKFKISGEPADEASARTLAKSNPHEFQAWIVDKLGGAPLEVSEDRRVAKKGGDRGIDGVLLFRDDPKAARSQRMVISVKSDASVNPAMVRELRGTMVREKATLGALLLLNDPTDGMRREAKADGQYKSENYKPVDKIQILSVADLFAGKSLAIPGMVTTHKSVPPAGAEGSTLELPFDKPSMKKTLAGPSTKKTRGPSIPSEPGEAPMRRRQSK